MVSQTHDPGAGGSWSSQMRGPGRARRSGCSAHAMACDESVCHLAPLVPASPMQIDFLGWHTEQTCTALAELRAYSHFPQTLAVQVTTELLPTQLRLWSRIVTGHQLFGTRFAGRPQLEFHLPAHLPSICLHLSPPQPVFWAEIMILAMLYTRFSEGVDAVKDLTEEEILNKSDDLLHSAEKSVKTDITKQFHSVTTLSFPVNHALAHPSSPFSMKLQGGFGRETRPTWPLKTNFFFRLVDPHTFTPPEGSKRRHSQLTRAPSRLSPLSVWPPHVELELDELDDTRRETHGRTRGKYGGRATSFGYCNLARLNDDVR